MYTMRELVIDAYDDAMIRSEGMQLTPQEMKKGMSMVNNILGTEFQNGDFQTTTVSFPVAFTGTDSYTIGPMPDLVAYPAAATPDFVLPVPPTSITMIVLIAGANARIMCAPCPGTHYFSRGVSNVENEYPAEFYYERTSPLSTIRFMMGTPNGPGEIIYKPAYDSATEDSDVDIWPEGLKPYLKWAVASKISAINRFDNTYLEKEAQSALAVFRRANYKGQSYTADSSAPGSGNQFGAKFQIYTGELV